jgi:hypothetical protein
LEAIQVNFEAIILDKRAMNTLDNMIHVLENARIPILSSMFLSGDSLAYLLILVVCGKLYCQGQLSCARFT